MSDDYGIDLDEILHVVDRSSVLIVRFEVLEPRLLIDYRADPPDLPLIQLVDRVNSAEERFRHLKSLRPRLPLPERISTFHWPRGVGEFVRSSIWERIDARMISLGADEERIRRVSQELLEHEHAVTIAAITGGEGFRTIWEREEPSE